MPAASRSLFPIPGFAKRGFDFLDAILGSLRITVSPSRTRAHACIGEPGAAARALSSRHGQVTLVGAGPGDAELLTVKAIRALQCADVVVYDALVSEEILVWTGPQARRVFAGKRGGCTSWRQDDINRVLADYALAGKNVVRLKGGDPSIFGRSGEEIDYLRDKGIGVAVVPGITAASAMAAACGISLTHRDCARSVRFVTGHCKTGDLPGDIDWRAIADPQTTTVFYMGANNASKIAEKMLAHGMSRATPVCIAASVSRPDAYFDTCTLETLCQSLARVPAGLPIAIGIGQVFRMASADASHAARLPPRVPYRAELASLQAP